MRAPRVRLGITGTTAARDGLPLGVTVHDVELGSPALKAGLRPGDTIIKVNGFDVSTTGDLGAALAQYEPGSSFEVVTKAPRPYARAKANQVEPEELLK